jgi:hypothetical protein
MVNAEVPRKIVAWTQAHVESRLVFLLAINVILLVVGTVMDIFSAIVVVLPLIGPIAKAYGIDPYHLGVIFLLNLEVGYLHPPVGLNLFITSVKFQRPITEVMWATIPFLITMIVALLVVTYVPALTVVPEAERTGRIVDLEAMIHVEVERRQVVSELALVDIAGNPLKDAAGAPIVRHLADCDKLTDDIAKGGCQQPFFDVKACRGVPDQQACEHKAIATWIVNSVNAVDDGTTPIIVVSEVALLDGNGAPATTRAGTQRVCKLASCAAAIDKDSCRDLFIKVSNCQIRPPDGRDAAACAKQEIAKWYDDNPSLIESCP